MYQSTVFPSHLPLAMSLISSTILHPQLTPVEIESQKAAAAYEIREIWAKPELILPEILHTVAYRDNTLGMPLLCPESQLSQLGETEVRGFMKDWYKPERMIVAGVGMAHEELVSLAEEHFGNIPSSSASTSASTSTSASPTPHSLREPATTRPLGSKSFATVSSANVDPPSEEHLGLAGARAVYTGGEQYIEKQDEEFVHLYIGFEGLGIHDPDIVSIQILMMACSDHSHSSTLWQHCRYYSGVEAVSQLVRWLSYTCSKATSC
jgi:processing peptidase subunit alpha